jgi:HK97 family phage major capsid protein
MPTTELRTKDQLFAEMTRLVNTTNYNLATRDQFNALKTLFDIANSNDATVPTFNRWNERTDAAGIAEVRRRAHEALRRDPAASEFFSGSNHRGGESVVSDFGTKLTKEPFRRGGQHVGAVVTMRSYAGLDTGTSGDAGGYSAPILFWETVTATLKQLDELFLAAQWINTTTGGTFDLPLADDIGNVAATVVETTGPVTDGPNPAFSQLQFGVAPLWSTGRIKCSVQLAQDSPAIEDYLARAFARRFARGMGATFVATLLSGIGTISSSSSSALVPDDLHTLIGGVDEEYARRGAWLMRYSTWIALRKMTKSNHRFISNNAQVDPATMRPYLLERPVYFCPGMDAIGAGKSPVIFGDLQRFVVRSVGTEQTIYKYLEAFMANHEIAWEGIWRTEGKLLKASSGDAPIVALRQPLS